MIISKRFTAICRGCKKPIEVFEYEGLEGGRYGSHHCKELSDLLCSNPRIRKVITNLKEVK